MHSLHHKELDVHQRGSYASMRDKYRGANKHRPEGFNINRKKIRDPNMVIIRNKFTKEVVDLEVSHSQPRVIVTSCFVYKAIGDL